MAQWFRRRSRRTEAPRIRPRSEDLAATRLDLHEFAPPVQEFLGRAAYVQLTIFENLSRAVASAPTTAGKAAIGAAAELSIAKHRALAAELERVGASVADAMEPYTASVDEFDRRTRGADWFETLMTAYITAGFLDDFFARLASGLPADEQARVDTIYADRSGEKILAEQLTEALSSNTRLAARLAMWGRRLVGDTMLVARSALSMDTVSKANAVRVEPVFTELIAAHTRRMDALGLTA
ncbi:hypothetical protein M2152_000606 [Microbacteriaceae bacterium SG_E_30_P1]|uniref:Ferritin-like domain-containing protein n=1 Tax=Antiquaquibacter oligotrophicus TaxID=2880260 RepID=A0ABT6KKN3_9MICO|nr:ferritin-like fold-containing protein [Antiquaquibacter oligotrophicus]MDH6180424.1 hypothetical protein [Antiquaquibacter oligotrophicus]UDF13838.1 ferritin-like domain-containing protein [Antiquaquibacter oligotrophicus]